VTALKASFHCDLSADFAPSAWLVAIATSYPRQILVATFINS
jgi:hypothetical protein